MFRMMNKLKNRKGFTLIELIVVLAVLAIIMAIAVPRFIGVQEDAKKNADKQTIQMIAKGAEMYFLKTQPTADDSIAATALVSNYVDSIKFQTSSYGSTSGAGLTVNYESSDGTIKIIGPSSKEVYPNNTVVTD